MTAINTGHKYAQTSKIFFQYYKQKHSPASFGYDYFISLPPKYDDDSSKAWPLLLFLHGAGESQRRAGESYVTLRHGIPKLVLAYDRIKNGLEPVVDIPLPDGKKVHPSCLSITPANSESARICAEEFITVTPSLSLKYGYGWNSSILDALLTEVEETWRVNKRKEYVTGFSMGGYGTWHLTMANPHRFAAIAPICGGGDPYLASVIAHIPHWIHHGVKDNIISIRESVEMEQALAKANAKEVKFTKYPHLEHDSWTEAYNNPEVFNWFLSHELPLRDLQQQKDIPKENLVDV